MTRPLPPDAREIVDAVLARARLRTHDRRAVRLDLESHFLDGLDAGVPLHELIDRFGDPAVVAPLIHRARRGGVHVAIKVSLVAAAVSASLYAIALVRLHAIPVANPTPALEGEAQYVAESVSRAHAALASRAGILGAFEVASALRARRSLWSETASLLLLDRVMAASDSLSTEVERQQLLDSLRMLAGRETLIARDAIIANAVPRVVDRVHGSGGRVDRGALRMWLHTKGVLDASAWVTLLEPIYFGRAASLAETHFRVTELIGTRVRAADIASRQLLARL